MASPYAQDKTVVIGLNDGGTGIMNNALSVYVGTKQAAGTEIEVVTTFEDTQGRTMRSGTKRLRVPKYGA